MKTKTLAAAAASAFIVGGVAAYAHSGATGIYKERMDSMMAMGAVIKSMSEMMRGEVEYDEAAVEEGARVIKSHAGDTMTELFPEGTTEAPSEARPEIWSDWETFQRLAKQLQTYAAGLEAAAGNGLAATDASETSMMGGSSMMGDSNSMMGSSRSEKSAEELAAMPADEVFGLVAQSCSSCHTKFRLEKN